MQLSDEQSTVRAVRIQQKRALEDQQKMVDEDLSRSVVYVITYQDLANYLQPVSIIILYM